MGRTTRRLIAVDIGNTAWKFGLFDLPAMEAAWDKSGLDFDRFDAPYPWSLNDCRDVTCAFPVLSAWLGAIVRRNKDESLLWRIASVNDSRTVALLDWLAANRPLDKAEIVRLADIPMESLYNHPERLGIDRLLAALGTRRFFGGGPALVADIGTATKVDFVDLAGRFAGGVILPGPETETRSLFERTDKLPSVDFGGKRFVGSYPATDTESAIRLGVRGSLLGAIHYFYNAARKMAMVESLPLLLTGGGAVGIELELGPLLQDGAKTARPSVIRTVRDVVLTGIFLVQTASWREKKRQEPQKGPSFGPK